MNNNVPYINIRDLPLNIPHNIVDTKDETLNTLGHFTSLIITNNANVNKLVYVPKHYQGSILATPEIIQAIQMGKNPFLIYREFVNSKFLMDIVPSGKLH